MRFSVGGPTRSDPVAADLSEVIGGRFGDHARPHRWWTPLPVMLALFTVVFSLGLIQKYPCGNTEWSNNDVRYARMCYSDIPYLYTGRGFAEHRWPYQDDDPRYPAMEYPALIAYTAWGVSYGATALSSGPDQATRAATPVDQLWGLPDIPREVNLYFLLTAILLFCFGLGTVYFLAGASPGRPWEALPFALSPILLVTGLVNWDLIAVMFTAGALWAWVRGRPVLAGVMVGLGTAAKLYPLFLLGAFLIDLLRRRRPDLAVPVAAGAAVTWALANLPALLTGPKSWQIFWSFNSDRGADLGSLWLVADQLGFGASKGTINLVSGVLFVAACAGILWLGLKVEHRPRVAQTAFLIVAAFLLVNKVYSPQYVLWLLPLAVLARPNWRDLIIWQAGELIYFGAVWLYLGGWLAPSAGGDSTAYQLAILIRVAAQVYLIIQVVSDMVEGRNSADDDLVDQRGGEPEPQGNLVADLRH